MHLAFRTDPLMQKFISLTSPLHAHLEGMFGRALYCSIVNPLRQPENEVFLLRPAKPSEIRCLALWRVEPEHIATLDQLTSLVRLAWPRSITDCRLYLDEQNPAEAYLVDIYGQKSSTRPLAYFRPRSSRTLMSRCLKLGGFCWHGPAQAIEPFLKLCSPPSEALPRSGLDDENQENCGFPD